jgi:hypothetical protein
VPKVKCSFTTFVKKKREKENVSIEAKSQRQKTALEGLSP